MDDLRDRFGALGWRQMPDLWAQTVRRAEELDATSSTTLVGGRVRARRASDRTLPGGTGLGWRARPALSAIVALLLLLALIVGSFAVGAWWSNRQLAVLPSDGPIPSRGPIVTALRPCDGMLGMADLEDTYLETNAAPSWTSTAPGDGAAMPGSITALMLDSLSNVGVSLVDPATGEACRLIDVRQAGLIPWEVRWSPDGNSIAVVTQLWAGSGETHLMVWSGGNDPTLTRPWIGAELPGIAWAPDSASMAVVADRTLTIVAGDGSAPRALACDPCRSPAKASWSPDGTRVAIRGAAPGGALGSSAIYVIDLDDGSLRQLDAGLARLDLGAWLDDATLLAFDYELDRLLELPVDTPTAYTVRGALQSTGDAAYTLSPDLTKAAFLANEHRSDEELIVADLITGAVTPLVRSADLDAGLPIGDIAWAPDGQSLAFTTVRTGPDWPISTGMWAIDVDGTGLRPIISGPFDLVDGRYLGSGPDLGSWRPTAPP